VIDHKLHPSSPDALMLLELIERLHKRPCMTSEHQPQFDFSGNFILVLRISKMICSNVDPSDDTRSGSRGYRYHMAPILPGLNLINVVREILVVESSGPILDKRSGKQTVA